MPAAHSRGCSEEVGAGWPSKSRAAFGGVPRRLVSQSEQGGRSRSWQRGGACQVCEV